MTSTAKLISFRLLEDMLDFTDFPFDRKLLNFAEGIFLPDYSF